MQKNGFQKAYEFTKKWEGGARFTQDPDDPGGATKYGVSFRFLENLPLKVSDINKDGKITWQDIKSLNDADAECIYNTYFWQALKLDLFEDPLGVVLFDTAVNIGKTRAIKALQFVVGSRVDGVIGPKTIESACKKDQSAIARAILLYREVYYLRLFKNQKWASKYIDGWLNRVFALYDYLDYELIIG